MMKKRPASRENSIIIGTILASGIVFVFGFFLGRAWVMIPQEQVDGYQKKSGAPVVLAEEKPETMILPRKKSLDEMIVKEKLIDKIKPQKQQELAQKPAILPKKQQMIVQKQGIEHGTQNTEQKQATPQVVQKPPVSQQKQQELAQKLAVLLQKQKQEAAAQKLLAQKLAMPQVAKKPIVPPQKQQMAVQKQSAEQKHDIPQVAQKPAASPQKQPVVVQKSTIPQATQKPMLSQQKKQESAPKLAALSQKQPVVTQKPTIPQATPKPTPQKQPEATQNSLSAQQKQPQQNPAPQKPEGKFALQLGSFSDEAKASALVTNLSTKGCSAYKLKMEMGEKGTWYRVYISGVFSSRIDAQQKGDGLKAQGVISNYFVISSK
ncbi:MAG: SPOR domain-containing protein [Candidatus Desantisbacteria bacterium]